VGIARIEELQFGVEDVDECVRFFLDFGLEEVEAEHGGATFRTSANQRLHLRAADDPGLPGPIEKGSTVRQIVWGVESEEDLSGVLAAVAADRDVLARADGTPIFIDETGFSVGMRVADVADVAMDLRPVNSSAGVGRWNAPLGNYDRAYPFRICHVALNIPMEGRDAAVAFYTERLGFRITDKLEDMGTFMQAPGDHDQHTFLLAHRPDRAGINHVAYEVRNFDEVIEGGNFMVDRGWKEARRLGRHTVGSNVFRFFHAPCGGRVEYAADMDRVDESYGPNIYTERPPHHLWMLRTRGDREEQ
jgi:catechol 2,3-dioxygenase-like lactoylglutathione lyase family enzyme